jgi:hypothetical protein
MNDGISIEDGWGVTIADFYREFSDGKFDEELMADDARHAFVKVLAGGSKTELTKVSLQLQNKKKCDKRHRKIRQFASVVSGGLRL